jgi:DNA-binding transcriptional MerR regulator
MSAGRAADSALLTVDELAAATGLSVRTTRYYTGLGLLPPPVRRGRLAYYGPVHRARLELVRSLQDHGFTLAAIERRLAEIPLDATPEELTAHRALLTVWAPVEREVVSRTELDERAGRPLTEEDLAWLADVGAVRARTAGYQVLPLVRHAVALLDAGLPRETVTDADALVRRHMTALADDLTGVLRDRVLPRYQDVTPATAEELERVLAHLRALTLDALVSSFQRAAAGLGSRAFTPREVETR